MNNFDQLPKENAEHKPSEYSKQSETAHTETRKITEKASDMEIVEFFSFHIDHPCTVELPEGEIVNIRDFYIREALGVLQKLENPFAIELLKKKIKQYR